MSVLPVEPAYRLAERADEHRRLVTGLWSEQAVGIVGGEPKCCKSFLALDLAVSVAIGRRAIERHFEQGIALQSACVIAVLIAGGDHQQAKAKNVGKRMGDDAALRGSRRQPARRSAMHNRCSTLRSNSTPPFEDKRPPSNLATTVPAGDRSQTKERQRRIVHGGRGGSKIGRFWLQQTLSQINAMHHSRHPAMNFSG